MNKNFTVITILALVVISGIVFYNRSLFSNQTPLTKLCYIRNTEDGVKTNMVIYISDTKINGQFGIWKNGVELKAGSFKGEITDVNGAEKTMTAETVWRGENFKEKLKIVIGTNIATPIFEKDGEYGLNLSLANCETEVI